MPPGVLNGDHRRQRLGGQAAAFLIALRTKGETVGEIAGLAAVLRERAVKVEAGDDLVDTAGTGGGRPTFNVSTTAAFIAAGAGCRVAKHGNRSATSQCGSADVLEALGGRIDVGVEVVEDCIREIGFGFMFAPLHHPAFKHIVPVRKELRSGRSSTSSARSPTRPVRCAR